MTGRTRGHRENYSLDPMSGNVATRRCLILIITVCSQSMFEYSVTRNCSCINDESYVSLEPDAFAKWLQNNSKIHLSEFPQREITLNTQIESNLFLIHDSFAESSERFREELSS